MLTRSSSNEVKARLVVSIVHNAVTGHKEMRRTNLGSGELVLFGLFSTTTGPLLGLTPDAVLLAAPPERLSQRSLLERSGAFGRRVCSQGGKRRQRASERPFRPAWTGCGATTLHTGSF